MGWFRLGDYLQTQKDDLEWNGLVDNLSQRVFDANPLSGDFRASYVQSDAGTSGEIGQLSEIFNSDTIPLGRTEELFLGKILNPANPVFCIVGQMGSGKTTTAKYIILNLIVDRPNSKQFPKTIPPLVPHIDFSVYENLKADGKPESETVSLIYEILNTSLQARVNLESYMSSEEEFLDFWNYEIDQYRNHDSTSISFNHICSQLPPEFINTNNSEGKERTIEARQEVFNASIPDKENLLLDYLIRKYRFILHDRFNSFQGDVVILLDNIDGLDPKIQSHILDVVEAHVLYDGPVFVLLLRPETFHHHGMGTGIIDTELHKGPTPAQVFLNRLEAFCNDPEKFFDPRDNLPRSEFEKYVQYFNNLHSECAATSRGLLPKHMHDLAGASIRTGQLIAQRLFRLTEKELTEMKYSCYDLFRLMIVGNPNQIHWSTEHPISHLFRVSDTPHGSYLVKPRILAYLVCHDRKRRRISEIIRTLKAFGYPETTITAAISDLSSIYCQLVVSTGYNYINDYEYLSRRPSDKLLITDLGTSYYGELLTNYDYVSEHAMDTWVQRKNPPNVPNDTFIAQKLSLLHTFLSELTEYDKREINEFTNSFGKDKYTELFGEVIISQRIERSCNQVASTIIGKQLARQKLRPSSRKTFLDLRDSYESLKNISESFSL